jgi:tryptophan 2,3-dioxygenase
LAKDDTPIDYSLQLKDVYKILEETHGNEWNNWYVMSTEKARAYLMMRLKSNRNHGTITQNYQVLTHTHGKQNTHNAHIHTNLAGKNGCNQSNLLDFCFMTAIFC